MKFNEVVEITKFLFNNKIAAHIDTKDEAYFNGMIIEIHETFLVLADRYWGMTPIGFSDIQTIEKFRSKEEEAKDEKEISTM